MDCAGGQTALNTGIELYNEGILKRYGVEVMGMVELAGVCTRMQ